MVLAAEAEACSTRRILGSRSTCMGTLGGYLGPSVHVKERAAAQCHTMLRPKKSTHQPPQILLGRATTHALTPKPRHNAVCDRAASTNHRRPPLLSCWFRSCCARLAVPGAQSGCGSINRA